jgi:hypothetical protein
MKSEEQRVIGKSPNHFLSPLPSKYLTNLVPSTDGDRNQRFFSKNL